MLGSFQGRLQPTSKGGDQREATPDRSPLASERTWCTTLAFAGRPPSEYNGARSYVERAPLTSTAPLPATSASPRTAGYEKQASVMSSPCEDAPWHPPLVQHDAADAGYCELSILGGIFPKGANCLLRMAVILHQSYAPVVCEDPCLNVNTDHMYTTTRAGTLSLGTQMTFYKGLSEHMCNFYTVHHCSGGLWKTVAL